MDGLIMTSSIVRWQQSSSGLCSVLTSQISHFALGKFQVEVLESCNVDVNTEQNDSSERNSTSAL